MAYAGFQKSHFNRSGNLFIGASMGFEERTALAASNFEILPWYIWAYLLAVASSAFTNLPRYPLPTRISPYFTSNHSSCD
eukprot:scaffold88094_cov52-Attheya_sp.AAC.1